MSMQLRVIINVKNMVIYNLDSSGNIFSILKSIGERAMTGITH